MVGGVQLSASLHISQLSHNFAGYVINTAGLENEVVGSISTNCWLDLKRKFMQIAFESLQNKFFNRVLQQFPQTNHDFAQTTYKHSLP